MEKQSCIKAYIAIYICSNNRQFSNNMAITQSKMFLLAQSQ